MTDCDQDVCVIFYRSCGHAITVTKRSLAEAIVAKTTGTAQRVAKDADIRELMTPRDRRCLCRVRDASVLAAFNRAAWESLVNGDEGQV